MNQEDIKEIISLLKNSTENQNWEEVYDVITQLKEFLDEYDDDDEENDI